jgi:hypothetical protein
MEYLTDLLIDKAHENDEKSNGHVFNGGTGLVLVRMTQRSDQIRKTFNTSKFRSDSMW